MKNKEESADTGDGMTIDVELTEAEEHTLTAPIWQQRPVLVCFQCERPVAKALGKALAEWKQT